MKIIKISVIHFSALGDIANALPFLRAMTVRPTIITTAIDRELLKDEFDDILILKSKGVREIYALSDSVVSAASTKAETFGRTAAKVPAMNTPLLPALSEGRSTSSLTAKTDSSLNRVMTAILQIKSSKYWRFALQI